MYSSTAGTGLARAERGSRIRAASFTPSGIAIQTGSRMSNSPGNLSRTRSDSVIPDPALCDALSPSRRDPRRAAPPVGHGYPDKFNGAHPVGDVLDDGAVIHRRQAAARRLAR